MNTMMKIKMKVMTKIKINMMMKIQINMTMMMLTIKMMCMSSGRTSSVLTIPPNIR